jgi:hypothetical protein
VQRLPSHEPRAALIIDLDSLSQEPHLEDLRSGSSSSAVAVHSYNIDEPVAAVLRAKGIIVSTHLEDAFPSLLMAIAAERNGDGEVSAPDPSAIAAEVRAVASQAHRVKKRYEGDGQAASEEWTQLGMRIDHLQRQLEKLRQDHQLRLDELLRWMGNLRVLVQAHGKSAGESGRF